MNIGSWPFLGNTISWGFFFVIICDSLNSWSTKASSWVPYGQCRDFCSRKSGNPALPRRDLPYQLQHPRILQNLDVAMPYSDDQASPEKCDVCGLYRGGVLKLTSRIYVCIMNPVVILEYRMIKWLKSSYWSQKGMACRPVLGMWLQYPPPPDAAVHDGLIN